MKKNIILVGLAGMLALSAGFSSCSPDYETKFDKKTLVIPDKSQAPIVFKLEGGQKNIQVETNVPFENWTATSNADWCVLDKQKDKVVVSVGENNIYKMRNANVNISYGHQSYDVIVTQLGKAPVILIEGKQEGYVKEIDAKLESLTIPVTTNLELDHIIVPDTCNWIRYVKPITREDSQTLKFALDQNTDTEIRYCTVILQSSQNYNHIGTFLIKQQKRGYIVQADESAVTYNVEASGKTITVPFQLNGPKNAYTYEIEESAREWIVPVSSTRAMRDASESFVIKPSTVEAERVGHITFRSPDPAENSSFVVTVTQEKFIPVPPFNVTNATATPGAGFITLNWVMPEKIDFTKLTVSYHDPVLTKDVTSEINSNSATSFVVKGTYKCGGNYDFTIKTYGPTGMATETPVTVTGTSEESPRDVRVQLTVDMLSANATQANDGSGLPGLVDGKKNTFYHTLWSSASPGQKPHYLQINLKEEMKTFRFEYDGRAGNNGGDVKRAGIWVSETGANDDAAWKKIETINFTLPAVAGGHGTPDKAVDADKPYKYIRFIPEARRNQDPLDAKGTNGWWNMAEIYLYRINFHDEAWARKELGL